MPSKNYFLYPYFMLLTGAFSWWIFHAHGDLVLLLNRNRLPVLDYFFKYWTYLGDGAFVALLFLLLLLWRWRLSIVFLAIGFVQFIISQGLKRFVFHDVPRPTKYFEGVVDLNLIEGVKNYGSFSFPSGHTITAFATATFFAILFRKNKVVSGVLMLSAILVGISRIYLLQHFLRDVMAGSLIGILISIGVWKIFENRLLKADLKH